MNGRQEYLKLLLNQEDPGLVGRTLVYYDYFNRARTQQIENVLTLLDKIESLSEDIRLNTAKLEQTRAARKKEKAGLEKTYRERALVLAKLNKDIKNKDQRLSQMTEDERRLQQLLQAINQAMPDILAEIESDKPFATYKES